nr:EOG090X0B7I [Macrothrix elegans]
MEAPPPFQQLPADPKFIDQIVNQIKSQGTFDQWRRECLADVDTKPAYQNLTFRVDNAVAAFLGKQRWRPDMVKNQVRENLRKHILELGFIEKGVDRIVEQVVQPKILPLFHPAVEDAIYGFLGIPNPRKEKRNQPPETPSINVSASPKKAFRPMPVSVVTREDDGATPPPGEEFELEAITPSPDSRSESRLKKELADEVSDVSMEDSSRAEPEAGLERICSPISPQSSSISADKNEEPEPPGTSRVGSALSAISSGDDLPSTSPIGGSPVTPENGAKKDENEQRPGTPDDSSSSSEGEDDDDDSDSSSPEFEKLEPGQPLSRTVTPVPGEEDIDEEEDTTVRDDHVSWRPKTFGRDPDRKPDEDPGPSSSSGRNGGYTENTSSAVPKTSTGSNQQVGTGSSGSTKSRIMSLEEGQVVEETIVNSSESVVDQVVEVVGTETKESKETEERSKSSSKDHRSRSHKSERREKSSHKDKERDKDRDKDRDRDRDRDRKRDKEKDKERDKDRERRREREKREESERRSKSHHKSHKSKDSDRKKSSHRDRDRDRSKDRDRDRDRSKDKERDRNKSTNESDKHRSRKEKDRKLDDKKEQKAKTPSTPPPSLHPKAYLWKRPEEKPQALWDYLARFPSEVFDENYNDIAGLTDVSVSSVSSFEDSDVESIVLHVSDVEVDSELEELIASTGGKLMYDDKEDSQSEEEEREDGIEEQEEIESDYAPPSEEFAPVEPPVTENHSETPSNKRVRKLNTRYSDSYVGSELRKMIVAKSLPENVQHSPRLPSTKQQQHHHQQQPRDFQENGISDSSPEDAQRRLEDSEYQQPDAKRLKTEQPLPSSPESVLSDPSHLPHLQPSTSPCVETQSSFVEDFAHNKDTISPTGRRRSIAAKQPQQRYNDADLYKPRPVITPSSRRSRRQEDP